MDRRISRLEASKTRPATVAARDPLLAVARALEAQLDVSPIGDTAPDDPAGYLDAVLTRAGQPAAPNRSLAARVAAAVGTTTAELRATLAGA